MRGHFVASSQECVDILSYHLNAFLGIPGIIPTFSSGYRTPSIFFWEQAILAYGTGWEQVILAYGTGREQVSLAYGTGWEQVWRTGQVILAYGTGHFGVRD